ncbi:MAG TPA: PorV/PorQ family protein [bacterium]|nr:PorV/PorQ family protein [bacterium]
MSWQIIVGSWQLRQRHLGIFTGIFLLITCHLSLVSLWSGSGRSGAQFLKIGAGARGIGLGSAYTAIANDITALYWNPAGLNHMKQKEFGFMHASWLAGTNYEFAGIGLPLSNHTIGIGAMYLNSGKLEGRSETGEPGGDFGASDLCVTISGARRIRVNDKREKVNGNQIDMGVSLKLIEQRIADEKANGIALDLGMSWQALSGQRSVSRLSHNSYRLPIAFGLAIKNIGTKMKFINEAYNLPLTITAGGGYNLLGSLVLTADISREIYDRKTSLSMGIEYSPMNIISLRAGYLYQAAYKLLTSSNNLFANEKSISDFTGLSAGLGINYSGYNLDYSLVPYADLGLTNRLSFKVQF